MWQQLKETFMITFQSLFINFAQFIANLVVAIVVLIIGVIIANLAGKGIEQIINAFKIDTLLRKADIEKYFTRAGVTMSAGKFLGFVVKWFLIILTVIQSLAILGLSALTQFLENVVNVLPNILVAALILLAGIVIAEFLARIISASVKAANMSRPALIGNVTRWVVWIFSILSALSQLGIGGDILNYVILGVISGLALALGLAFGLGGRDAAANIIEKVRHDMADHGHGHNGMGGRTN